MALDADPYRTLGLASGASIDEVKRAYRRLAKAHHPDAAGEKALPRFLAIQAAYEQLIGGPDASKGGRRASSGPGGGAGTSAASGRGGATDGPRPGGRSWSSRTADAGSGSPRTGRRRRGEPRGATGDRPDDPPPGATDGPPNKATLGSTSYDGADAGPFEPDWGGASWYGTTSGTYWTLNPKEYADPRKHGPEYQARARRAVRPSGSGASGPTSDATADPVAGATHTTSSWWESTAGSAGSAAPGPAGPDPGAGPSSGVHPRPTGARPDAVADPPPPDLGRAAVDIGRVLTDEKVGGLRSRVARAILGWLPIALGGGWLVGELTGCGRFSAACDGMADPFVLMLQAAVLAVLLLVPAVASVAATAAITLLVAAGVAALILSATGSAPDGDSRQSALGAVLLLAWLTGIAIAVVRRARTLPTPTRPVS